MNTTLTALFVFGFLIGTVLLGMGLRRVLPEDHLSAESKDVVKLAMGLVATMAALVLGLLVSSAKGAYDTKRSEVIQMAAKIAFLDRLLTVYGPEAAQARAQKRACRRSWLPTRKQVTWPMPRSSISRLTTTSSAAPRRRP